MPGADLLHASLLSALPGLCLRLLERRSARACWGWRVAVATRSLQVAALSASRLLGTGEGTPGNLRPGRAAEGVWSRGAARPKRGREEAGERDQCLLLSQRLAFSPRSPSRADSRRRRLAAGERGSAWNAGPGCARPLPLPQCGLRAGPEPKTVPGGPRSGSSPPWGGRRVRGWGGPR